jgi:hypothetical protein
MIHPSTARATHLRSKRMLGVTKLSKNSILLKISKFQLHIQSSSSSKIIGKNKDLKSRTTSLKISLSRKKEAKALLAKSLIRTKIAQSSD